MTLEVEVALNGLAPRADLLVQFMQFQRMAPGGADGPETLQ